MYAVSQGSHHLKDISHKNSTKPAADVQTETLSTCVSGSETVEGINASGWKTRHISVTYFCILYKM